MNKCQRFSMKIISRFYRFVRYIEHEFFEKQINADSDTNTDFCKILISCVLKFWSLLFNYGFRIFSCWLHVGRKIVFDFIDNGVLENGFERNRIAKNAETDENDRLDIDKRDPLESTFGFLSHLLYLFCFI